MAKGLRTKKNTDIITFPATKAAAAITLASDEYYDFEGTGLSDFELIISAEDNSKITDTILVKPYVSFDKGSTFLQVDSGYTELVSTGGTAAVAEVTTGVISATGGDTVAEYDGRWFALYTGTTPTVFWFDATGSDTVPAHGITGATEVSMDISAAGDTADGIGAAFVAVIDALAGWGATYTAGTDTFVITNATAGANTNVNTGNMLTATAVVDSLAVTTQGVDAILGSAAYKHTMDIAPRVRVDADFDGSAELAAGHGCQVDLIMTEVDYGMRKEVFADVLDVGTSQPNGFILYSDTISTTGLYKMEKAWLATYCGDLSKVTDTVGYVLQASDDGANWWDASAVGSDLANGSGILHSLTSVVHGTTYYLGKYLRVKLYSTDLSGLIAADHEIQFNVVVEY